MSGLVPVKDEAGRARQSRMARRPDCSTRAWQAQVNYASTTAATAAVGATMLVMLFVSLWTLIEGDAMATADGAGTPSISLSGEGNQRLDRTHASAS